MQCHGCNHSIKPGLELVLQPGKVDDAVHCPYCLEPVTAEEEHEQEADVSVQRFALRREVRRRFVDQLRAEMQGRAVRCPKCEHPIDRNNLLVLEIAEHYNCPGCSTDLAYAAYRREAYRLEPWLKVASALADAKAKKTCTDCCYLGAAARACQLALSWSPEGHAKHDHLLATLVRQAAPHPPQEACTDTCPLLGQYRREVGNQLLLL